MQSDDNIAEENQEHLTRDCTKIFYQMQDAGHCIYVGWEYTWNNGDVGKYFNEDYVPTKALLPFEPPVNLGKHDELSVIAEPSSSRSGFSSGQFP